MSNLDLTAIRHDIYIAIKHISYLSVKVLHMDTGKIVGPIFPQLGIHYGNTGGDSKTSTIICILENAIYNEPLQRITDRSSNDGFGVKNILSPDFCVTGGCRRVDGMHIYIAARRGRSNRVVRVHSSVPIASGERRGVMV